MATSYRLIVSINLTSKIMEVKVIKRFRDKHDKVTYYEAGQVCEFDDERAKDLIERGIVEPLKDIAGDLLDVLQHALKDGVEIYGGDIRGEGRSDDLDVNALKGQTGEDAPKDDAPVQTEKVEEPVQTAVADEAEKEAEKTEAKAKAKAKK